MRSPILVSALLIGAAGSAQAQIHAVDNGVGGANGPTAGEALWDQSGFIEEENAFVHQEFPDFGDFSAYMVNDVVVGEGGWNVTSVSTYHTVAGNQDGLDLWPDEGTARLNIFPKDGAMPNPGDDPTAGMEVAVTFEDVTDGTQVMTASGLDVDLEPGEYWIGLTPSLGFSEFNQEFHRAAEIVGMDTFLRNPGGAFDIGTDWVDTSALGDDNWVGTLDMAMLIEGSIIPAPGAVALVGLGGLAALRRRR